MSYIGTGVEYALHSLLWIAASPEQRPSARDLAELQGVSPSFVAKLMALLEKAEILQASHGIKGGYTLARPASSISVLDVVEAIDGQKPIFDCQEIRSRCVLFNGNPPEWATSGVCGIHAIMLRAEKSLREELARSTLDVLSDGYQARRLAPGFGDEVKAWLGARQEAREVTRVAAVKARNKPASST